MTGNPVSVANMKLKAAGIDPHLFTLEYKGEKRLIGGFGDDDAYRPGMVKAAIERFENIYGQEIDPTEFLIIGDTPKDIWVTLCNLLLSKTFLQLGFFHNS